MQLTTNPAWSAQLVEQAATVKTTRSSAASLAWTAYGQPTTDAFVGFRSSLSELLGKARGVEQAMRAAGELGVAGSFDREVVHPLYLASRDNAGLALTALASGDQRLYIAAYTQMLAGLEQARIGYIHVLAELQA